MASRITAGALLRCCVNCFFNAATAVQVFEQQAAHTSGNPLFKGWYAYSEAAIF